MAGGLPYESSGAGAARRRIAALALAVAITVSSIGSAQAPPAFRSAVELVEVGVVVVDRAGNPVRGLTREDFELLDEGRPQAIQTFSAIEVPDALPASAGGAVTLPPDIVTPPIREGRLYVVVLDAPSTATMPADYRDDQAYTLRTKQVAKQFVEEVTRPGDMVAIVHAQGTARDAQTFTGDRRLLLASIDRFGRGLSGNTDSTVQGKELVARNLASYAVLRSLAERLGAIDGKRKAIVWIGGQIDFNPARFSTRTRMPGSPAVEIADSAAELDAAYRDTIRAAAVHNVAIYSIDPAGAQPDTGEGEQSRVASLRAMAEETGALAVVNTNNFSPVFARISRELSSSYVMGFAPEAPGRAGFHRLTVRVRRPNLTVRTRSGYYASTSAAGAKPAPPRGLSTSLFDALRRPIGTRGIGIDLFTAAFDGTGQNRSVLVAAHIYSDAVVIDAAQPFAVAYQLFDDGGRVVKGMTRTFTLPPAAQPAAVTSGVEFVERIPVRAGRYEFRIAVEQPGNGLGAVVASIDAERADTTRGLTMSAVALASERANDVRLLADATSRATMGASPTARRRFKRDETLIAFAEIDAARNAGPWQARGLLQTPDGRVVVTSAGQRVSTRERGAGVRAVFRLKELTAGAYVLVLQAEPAAGEKGSARREVPMTIEE